MKKDQNLNWRQKKEIWESFNDFAMSDIESSNQGKAHRNFQGRQEEVTEWWRGSMKHWEKESVIGRHQKEHQM